MSLAESKIIDLSPAANRPTRTADWKRVFRDACSDALASGEPPGDATIAKAIDACSARFAYGTWTRFPSLDTEPPSARTLRRWHKALVTCPRRAAPKRSPRSAAKTTPSRASRDAGGNASPR